MPGILNHAITFLVFTWILATPAQNCLELADDAVAWWRAEESIWDDVGGFGMEQSGELGFEPSVVGKAWVFNGTNTEIRVRPSWRVGLNAIPGQGITFEAWVAPEEVAGTQTFLSWGVSSVEQDVVEVFLEPPATGAGMWTLGVRDALGSSTMLVNLNSGEFSHVAFSYDPVTGDIPFYVNGELSGIAEMPLGGGNFLDEVKFGGKAGSRYKGRLDEVVFYSRELSAEEIRASAMAGEHCSKANGPEFIREPVGRTTTAVGEILLITTEVQGAGPLSFQWRHDGTNVSATSTGDFFKWDAEVGDAGAYELVVQNQYGSITSRVTQVIVNLLANGSFDNRSLQGWTTQDLTDPLLPMMAVAADKGVPFPLFRSAPIHGPYSMIHGFSGTSPGTIRLMQDLVELPEGMELSFSYRAGWNLLDYGPATQGREFRLVIEPRGGGEVLFTKTFLRAEPQTKMFGTPWRSEIVSLNAFAGREVRLVFEWTVPEGNTGPGMFELDGVKLINRSGPPISAAMIEGPEKMFKLKFRGDRAFYSVWSSTRLTNWANHGAPATNIEGELEFEIIGNREAQFFYVTSP